MSLWNREQDPPAEADVAGAIHTVTGAISPDLLGPTLIHEHLVVQWSSPGVPLRTYDEEEGTLQIRKVLEDFRELGGGALVDVTMYGYGRRAGLLRAVSSATGVSIIAVIGSFTDQWASLPDRIVRASVEELVEFFAAEIEEGIERTSVRAGGVKCGTGDGRVSEGERKVLRAAALAQARTGAPILTHTTNGSMIRGQLDILEEAGADLAKVVIGHLRLGEDLGTELEVVHRGACVGFDKVGNPGGRPDREWCRVIGELLDADYADRILLSHDAAAVWAGPAEFDNAVRRDYNHVLGRLVPALRRMGLSDDAIQSFLIENPRRFLQF